MKTVYISCDGNIFFKERECKDHEFMLSLGKMADDIVMYDEDGFIVENFVAEDAFFDIFTVEVLSEAGLNAIRLIEKYTGDSYNYIDSVGMWEWKLLDGFRKVENND